MRQESPGLGVHYGPSWWSQPHPDAVLPPGVELPGHLAGGWGQQEQEQEQAGAGWQQGQEERRGSHPGLPVDCVGLGRPAQSIVSLLSPLTVTEIK